MLDGIDIDAALDGLFRDLDCPRRQVIGEFGSGSDVVFSELMAAATIGQGGYARRIVAGLIRHAVERNASGDIRRSVGIERAVLGAMPYSRYLNTPHWRDFSAQAKRDARGRCRLCNADGELHVHHRTYERRGFENKDDVIVLCADCHGKFHDKLPKPPPEGDAGIDAGAF
jgi:hypothetical protein